MSAKPEVNIVIPRGLTSEELEILPHYTLLGLIVVRWNRLEQTTREFIEVVCEDGRDAAIISTHMGTNSLFDALRVLSEEKLSEEWVEHIRHMIVCIRTVRDYRNYYVHGAHFPSKGGLLIRTATARKSFNQHDEIVTVDDLQGIIYVLDNVFEYSWSLFLRLRAERKGETPLPPWPDKPDQPNTLDKSRRPVPARLPQQISSVLCMPCSLWCPF